MFAKLDVPISAYVGSRVLSAKLDGDRCPPYQRNHGQVQAGRLNEIKNTLGN